MLKSGYKKYKPAKIPTRKAGPPTLVMQGKSKEELAILNTIKLEFPSLPVYESNRAILHGREIDIWIPSKSVGIEFNGLYFHNSTSKTENYHLWKNIECEKQNIRLIQIFSDEWELKKSLVIDLIKKSLGKYQLIPENRCIPIYLSINEAKSFYESSDLAQFVQGDYYIGLQLGLDIICAMTLKELGQNKFEIIQYSCRHGLIAENGAKQLIKFFLLSHKVNILQVSVDRRLHSFKELEGLSIRPAGSYKPQIYYTKDFKSRKLLESFKKKTDADLTKEGYVKIYDSGKLIGLVYKI